MAGNSHLDIPWLHMRGHLWATLLGYGQTGDVVEMFVGYGFIFFGITLIIFGWKQIYATRKESGLITSKLYRFMRHPQYSGIFLALFGQLIHWPTLPTLILFPFIIWSYVHLAKKEEKKLTEKFGREYLSYKNEVPMFFPGIRQWRQIIKAI